MKQFRIVERSPGNEGENEAWWPAEGVWEGEDGAAAIQAWADETEAAGESEYLAIPVDAIETVKVTIERRFHTDPAVPA